MELQDGCSCSKNSTSGKCNTRWKAKPIETWFKARCSQHPIVVLRSNDVLGLANLIHFPKRKRNKCTATPFPFWKTNQTACDKARTNANKSPSIQSHRPILCPWSEESACSCPCYQSIRGSETNQEIHSIHINTLQTGTTGTLHQQEAGFASNSATHEPYEDPHHPGQPARHRSSSLASSHLTTALKRGDINPTMLER